MIPVLLLVLQASAGPSDSAIEQAVRGLAARAPIEAFGKEPGFVTVRDVALLRADDGALMAYVSIVPRYSQTPTVLAFAFNERQEPHLSLEALVPGRLQPWSGRLVDPHTIGFGVDVVISRLDIDRILAAADRGHMSLVRYASFFHGDVRTGYRMYVDLSDRALLSARTSEQCAGIEFSPVERLVAGSLAGSEARYLVALTAHEITLYRIHRVRPNGTLDKESWVRQRAPDVTGLELGPGGQVLEKVQGADSRPLAAP